MQTNLKKNLWKKAVFATTLFCCVSSMSYGQSASVPVSAAPVLVFGVGGNAVSSLLKLYQNALAYLFNKAFLPTYVDVAYEFDAQIPTTIVNNQNLADALKPFSQNLQNTSLQNINVDLAGVKVHDDTKVALTHIIAGDDVEVPSSKGFWSGIFGSNSSHDSITTNPAVKGNSNFDIESLLGPDTYSEDQQKSAQGYLAQIKSIAAPLVIHLGPTFDVPISNSKNPYQQTVTIGDKTPLTPNQLATLKETLQTYPVYRDYKVAYRNMIAMRSLFLDILNRSYQERLSNGAGKQSVRQILNEETNRRLKADYYKSMSTASPDTVNREILFTLVEINSQLNTMREQNERLLVMNAISNLNSLTAETDVLNDRARAVGKAIYCDNSMGNQNTDICSN